MLARLLLLIRSLEWIFDYYFAYFLYNGNKHHRYFDYMCNKWGSRFTDRVDQNFRDKYP
jgi:hypothetical protein